LLPATKELELDLLVGDERLGEGLARLDRGTGLRQIPPHTSAEILELRLLPGESLSERLAFFVNFFEPLLDPSSPLLKGKQPLDGETRQFFLVLAHGQGNVFFEPRHIFLKPGRGLLELLFLGLECTHLGLLAMELHLRLSHVLPEEQGSILDGVHHSVGIGLDECSQSVR